ncbi:hypothetical protein C9E81_06885 [Paracoccus alkanivorans]|uniref:Host specificity protein n=1 Tax=Paracoccus alkanivorans TaxID=2116655 RepID=A0A3M0MFC9_9RHOB|nr:glycoside hydrolase TIM-barrel-like domain-containing protein [Paracoccus alkanivorans]RMC36386.1 hypothetical protein C9E81_06885 [Paracoccus alkanivorans]
MPWRGRITTSVAAGRESSPDGSKAAEAEVAAFFGQAGPGDFIRDGERIEYRGPEEWSYRRFVLHYAHLCAVAGGVDSFLIGSEMVGMTRIRGAGGSYPAVAALRRLAADVRAVLGPEVRLGYAADWSEYFGHHPGGGELFFHLDPLWADGNIDFIGIDNYMPLSDWRDPAFPARRDLWSDGPAWERGHWLNGRAGAVPLASVVGDICREAGVRAFDTSGLSGVVHGYRLEGQETGRAALQPLMLAHGFDAVERDGVLRFVMRDGRARGEIGPDDLAVADGLSGIEVSRAPDAEIVGRLRLSHVEAGGDYAVATAEAILPGDVRDNAAGSEFPMLLTRAEGRAIAERWLAEAEVSRDRIRFALPPSRADLGPGDVLRVAREGAEAQSWRIDRVERAGAISVEAVRVDPGVYRPARAADEETAIRRYVPPLPVWPVFMDLPLMRGDEAPHAPYLAVSAHPWPGSVAAYMSVEEEGGFDLNLTLTRRAVMGRTLTPLARARPGMIDRGAPLRLRIKGDQLRSVGRRALWSGANLLAIGDGSAERWELLQFARAEPVGDGIWEIRDRLRGQAGTDGVMPSVWPAGSLAVLMDGAVRQVALPPSARGQERFWRIGPALRAPDDASYRGIVTGARGIGLRPYAPCHLRIEGRRIRWIRRARVDGDGWDGPEVPLGETREAYLLRLSRGGEVIHQVQVPVPEYRVPEGVWSAALAGGAFTVAVAQLSEQFGAGPFVRRDINDGE